MGRIIVVLTDKTENRLRKQLRKRGDLSRIVEEALMKHIDELEKEGE